MVLVAVRSAVQTRKMACCGERLICSIYSSPVHGDKEDLWLWEGPWELCHDDPGAVLGQSSSSGDRKDVVARHSR